MTRKRIILYSVFILAPLCVLAGVFFGWSKDSISDREVVATEEEQKAEGIKVLIAGDIMMDRHVREAIKKKGLSYPFQKIEGLLSGNDLTLANLEGPLSDFPPKRLEPNNIVFTFDPRLSPVLKSVGFNVFNLANNHALNFGQKGLAQTKKYLETNQIDFFGDPLNREGVSMIKEARGLKVGFVGYNELGKENWNSFVAEIKKIKSQTDFVMAYLHWGTEYQTNFSKKQQKMAHQLVDAGADVVLGSHPHVIQPMEIYNNKAIFYSLGNFLFDQTFSVFTQQGLAVGLVIEKHRTNYNLFPTEIQNFQITLAEGEKKSKILKGFLTGAAVPKEISKQILEDGTFVLSENQK